MGKFLHIDTLLTFGLLLAIGVSIGIVTSASRTTFDTVSRHIVETGAGRCAEQVAHFLSTISANQQRISSTVSRGVIRSEADVEAYVADMYSLFVDNTEFLAVYHVLPSGRTLKVHREDVAADGVTQVLKFMDWTIVNATTSKSQNFLFLDPSRPEVRVAEPPEYLTYSPNTDDEIIETRALPGDGLHFAGPVVETYTGTDRYIFELLFTVPWPNITPPVKSVFKIEVLIAKINTALEDASKTSGVSGFVLNANLELVGMASSLPIEQITEDAESGERRFIKLSESPYLTKSIFGTKGSLATLEKAVADVLTAGNPAAVDFRSGGRYIVKVSRLGLGTDWVIVTFADIKEGLGGLERGQKAITISLAVAIVLVISFTLYTVVVRVAFKNRLTNRYEVIFNSTSEGIILCDDAGLVKTFNQAASKLIQTNLGRELKAGDPLKALFEHGAEVQAELQVMIEDARAAEIEAKKGGRSASASARRVGTGPSSVVTSARSDNSGSRLEVYRMEAGSMDPSDTLLAQTRGRLGKGKGGAKKAAALSARVSIKTNLAQLPVVVTMGTAALGKGKFDAVVVVKDDGTQRRYEMALVENARVTELVLLSLMPRSIAERMKRRKTPADRIADTVEECSCFFMDLISFTVLAGSLPAADIVEVLNELYTGCDDIISQYPSLEKVKTIGDAIFVVGGAPVYHPSHVQDLVSAAFQMQQAVVAVSKARKLQLGFRQGIHVGPAVSGVVGKLKQTWDLWGDTVNVAARTEANAEPNTLCVTAPTRAKMDPSLYHFKERKVDMKGKGATTVFTVTKK